MKEKKSLVLYTKFGTHLKIDNRDIKMIAILSEDARINHTYLAQSLNLSKDTIRYRYEKLVKNDVLTGNIAIINPFALGFELCWAFIRMNIISEEKESELHHYFFEHKFTLWGGTALGNYDYAMLITFKNNTHLREILDEIKGKCGNALITLETVSVISIISYRNIPKKMLTESGITIHRKKADPSFGDLLERPVLISGDNKIKLDKLDNQLVYELSLNSKQELIQLAQKTKTNINKVKYRIRNLIRNKVIGSFNPLINIPYLGFNAFAIFLELQFNIGIKRINMFESFLKEAFPYVFKTNGEWDYIMFVAAKDLFEFYHMLLAMRNTYYDLVKDFATLTIIKDFKFTFFSEGMKTNA